MAGRPELVIAQSRTGRFVHLTGHEDPRFWHMKATVDGTTMEYPWSPPTEFAPGARRLIQLALPLHAIRCPAPPRASRVSWFTVAPAEDEWTYFTVVTYSAEEPVVRNGEPIGRITMADGARALVVAGTGRALDVAPIRLPDVNGIRAKLSTPGHAMLLHGLHPDGAFWFLEMHNTSRDEAAAGSNSGSNGGEQGRPEGRAEPPI
jgi:hypothetical protein